MRKQRQKTSYLFESGRRSAGSGRERTSRWLKRDRGDGVSSPAGGGVSSPKDTPVGTPNSAVADAANARRNDKSPGKHILLSVYVSCVSVR